MYVPNKSIEEMSNEEIKVIFNTLVDNIENDLIGKWIKPVISVILKPILKPIGKRSEEEIAESRGKWSSFVNNVVKPVISVVGPVVIPIIDIDFQKIIGRFDEIYDMSDDEIRGWWNNLVNIVKPSLPSITPIINTQLPGLIPIITAISGRKEIPTEEIRELFNNLVNNIRNGFIGRGKWSSFVNNIVKPLVNTVGPIVPLVIGNINNGLIPAVVGKGDLEAEDFLDLINLIGRGKWSSFVNNYVKPIIKPVVSSVITSQVLPLLPVAIGK